MLTQGHSVQHIRHTPWQGPGMCCCCVHTHEVVEEALVASLADISHVWPLGGCALQGSAGGAHYLLQRLLQPVDVLCVRQLRSPDLT